MSSKWTSPWEWNLCPSGEYSTDILVVKYQAIINLITTASPYMHYSGNNIPTADLMVPLK